jgi:hypothetical protein
MRRIPASTCLNAASDVSERANPLRPGHRLGTDDTENTSAIVDLHCQARHSHRASTPSSSSDRSPSPLVAFLVNRRKLHSRVSSPYLGTQPPPSLPSFLPPSLPLLPTFQNGNLSKLRLCGGGLICKSPKCVKVIGLACTKVCTYLST